MKVSFIFPIYKKSSTLFRNLEKIKKYKEIKKEIIIIVDCPTSEFRKKLERIRKNFKEVLIVINDERRGKVEACNYASEIAKGDILVFLDSDVLINKIDFEELIKACNEYDIVDFRKKVLPIGFLGKLMAIEYLGYFLSCLKSSTTKKIIIFNGAAFAIKKEKFFKYGKLRKFYIEDVEFGTRVSISGGTYYLCENCEVEILPLKSFKSWIEQRKRWSYGFIEWLTHYIRSIASFFSKNPNLLFRYLFILNPGIIVWLLLLLLPIDVWVKLTKKLLIFLASNFSIFVLFIPISTIYIVVKYLIITLLSFLSLLIYYNFSAKKHRFWFSKKYFIVYFFFYSPFFMFILFGTTLFYLFFWKPPKFSWKV